MEFSSKRLQREARTIDIMIHRYCADHHGTHRKLCPDCEELLHYANKRLANCPFQEKKSTCGKCEIHCYKPEYREKIRKVMRYVGPRMLLTNPILAFYHFMDGLRSTKR